MTAGGDGYEVDFVLSCELWSNPTREEVARVVNVVDVEHDESRGDGVGRFACAVATESASVRRDDR